MNDAEAEILDIHDRQIKVLTKEVAAIAIATTALTATVDGLARQQTTTTSDLALMKRDTTEMKVYLEYIANSARLARWGLPTAVGIAAMLNYLGVLGG